MHKGLEGERSHLFVVNHCLWVCVFFFSLCERVVVRPPRPAPPPHRGVLALDAGGVESHGGDPLHLPLDVEHTLVVLLARLRLRQIASTQRDWPNHPGRDQDVSSGDDLRAALQKGRREGSNWAGGGKKICDVSVRGRSQTPGIRDVF